MRFLSWPLTRPGNGFARFSQAVALFVRHPLDFLKVYREALITAERETNPELERIIIEEHED